MKKLSNVVMLATEEASNIKIGINNRYLYGGLPFETEYINQHLYFTNDEELKKGDWILINRCIIRKCEGIDNNSLSLIKDTNGGLHSKSVCEKIIASTDESLRVRYKENNHQPLSKYNFILPRPSNEFLRKYCKLGGIDEVLIEYWDINNYSTAPIGQTIHDIKVASDNTITIYPVNRK